MFLNCTFFATLEVWEEFSIALPDWYQTYPPRQQRDEAPQLVHGDAATLAHRLSEINIWLIDKIKLLQNQGKNF